MNQTPELIFRKTNFVTAKHMKTFSFLEMLLREPNTAVFSYVIAFKISLIMSRVVRKETLHIYVS